MSRKKIRKGCKFGNGTNKQLQIIELPGSDLNNLCKAYKTASILHGDPLYREYRKRISQ